jgi:aspartate-semialdehyde dehydrogenase
MLLETRKIFHAPDLAVTATAVRVPTRIGHGEAVNVEFHEALSAEEARGWRWSGAWALVLGAPG